MRALQHARWDRAAFAVLLAQDLAVVPLLFIVAAFASDSGTGLPVALTLAFGRAALAVVLILGLGKLFIQPLLRFVRASESPELFVAATLLVVIATASVTYAVGLSAALGAFWSACCSRRPSSGLILRSILNRLRACAGLVLHERWHVYRPRPSREYPVWIALSVLGLFAIKTAVTFVCARLFDGEWASPGDGAVARTGWRAALSRSLAVYHLRLPSSRSQPRSSC